jgi:hypothetical protein
MGPTNIGADGSTLWKLVEFTSSISTTHSGPFLAVCCDLFDLKRVGGTKPHYYHLHWGGGLRLGSPSLIWNAKNSGRVPASPWRPRGGHLGRVTIVARISNYFVGSAAT